MITLLARATPGPLVRHIHSYQGFYLKEDKQLRFYVVKGYPIRIASRIEVDDTTIKVYPLREAVVSGAFLRFGDVVLTTTAAADAGDTTISISAAVSVINRESQLYQCQDITDWSFNWTIDSTAYKTDHDYALLTFEAPSPLTQGVVLLTIPKVDTQSLPPIRYYHKFTRVGTGTTYALCIGDLYAG